MRFHKPSVSYAGKTFEMTTVEQQGSGLLGHTPTYIHPFTVDENHPIQKSMNQTFDFNEFSTARLPIHIGNVPAGLVPMDKTLRILDMPIKFPHSDYRIPADCAPFADIINAMAQAERILNSESRDCYAYLTIDSSFVKKDESQRNSGAHVDGFQGARITEKVRADRSYIMVSDFPTGFYNQPWDISGLDPAIHNFFNAFDRQKKAENLWTPEARDILLMDAYTVHEAGRATESKHRVFVRLSFSVREFDRLGNTHNPLFNYSWDMVPREIQKTLV